VRLLRGQFWTNVTEWRYFPDIIRSCLHSSTTVT